MAQHRVGRSRSVEKYLDKHTDLAARWPGILIELEANPYPRTGSDLISHLKGPLFCRHRIRDPGYRYLYEIGKNRAVWVYDVDVRGQVY